MPEVALASAPSRPVVPRRVRQQPAIPWPGEEPPPWAAMLGRFYEKLGLSVPRIVRLDPRQLPLPSRRLLAHNRDMTRTLERFYGETVALQVCGREREGDLYLREVVLALTDSGTPVEYGVICVHLRHFFPSVRERILSEEHPFGRILQEEGIAHLGWPQAFFSIEPDAHIRSLLGFDQAPLLHGRRNVLLDGRRRLLAEVIEILAPLEEPAPCL
jgi:chorismate-pyruvate lyase